MSCDTDEVLVTIPALSISKFNVSSFNFRSLQRFIACVGDKPLRFVGPIDAETFKEHLIQQVGRVSANVYLRTLKTAFNTAIRLRLTQDNPLQGCRLFRIPPKDPVYIPKEDFAKLLVAIRDHCFRNLVLFAALTGMRRGELISLRWSDIDQSSRLIRIRNKDDFTVKGMRSRSIPINRDLFSLILKMPRESEHVLLDTHGKPYDGSTVTKKFKHIIRTCGLSEKIHFHSLRHTYASWLVQSATPLAEIQKLLGHTSVVTTQIYAHLDYEHLRNAVEKIQLAEFTENASHETTRPVVVVTQPSRKH